MSQGDGRAEERPEKRVAEVAARYNERLVSTAALNGATGPARTHPAPRRIAIAPPYTHPPVAQDEHCQVLP